MQNFRHKAKKVFVIALLLFVCLCSIGCWTNIYRYYYVTITASDGSTVYFDAEILAEIEKQSEAEQRWDIRTDADLVPY